MILEIGYKINKFHDKLRLSKDKFFYPIADVLPKWVSANRITVFRLIMIFIWLPFVIIMPRTGQFAVFLIIYFLDLLDGSVARARSQITRFGEYLDHFSDRINSVVLGILINKLTDFQFLAIRIFMFWELFIAAIIILSFYFKMEKLNSSKFTLHLIGNIILAVFFVLELIKFFNS